MRDILVTQNTNTLPKKKLIMKKSPISGEFDNLTVVVVAAQVKERLVDGVQCRVGVASLSPDLATGLSF